MELKEGLAGSVDLQEPSLLQEGKHGNLWSCDKGGGGHMGSIAVVGSCRQEWWTLSVWEVKSYLESIISMGGGSQHRNLVGVGGVRQQWTHYHCRRRELAKRHCHFDH